MNKYNSEREWYSQILLQHTDYLYNTNATLYLNISSSSSIDDYSNIQPPKFEFNIRQNTDKTYRSCKITCTDASDLLLSLNSAFKHSRDSGEALKITKNYDKNNSLHILLMRASNGEEVAQISIIRNDSDFGKICVPKSILFPLIVEKLKSYTTNYDRYISMVIQLANNRLLSKVYETNKAIETALKILPTQIGEIPDIPKSNIQSQFDSDDENIQTEFDNMDFDSIQLDEVDKLSKDEKTEIIDEIGTELVTKICHGDIEVFSNLISAIIPTDTPLLKLKDTLGAQLPDISEDELKSALYFSKLQFQVAAKEYINKDVAIPLSSVMIKYNPENISKEDTLLAYDLLTIMAYVKILRTKLEEFDSDATKNKALMYFALRCYGDIFIFSFISKIDPKVIATSVIRRFKKFKSMGFFDSFDKIIETYKCKPIIEEDILYFINELTKKALSNTIPTVSEIHENAHSSGRLRLPSYNKFSIEQITNDIVNLEIAEKSDGKSINSKEIALKILGKEDIDSEILDLFTKDAPKKKPKKSNGEKPQKVSHINRTIKNNLEEIPEEYRDLISGKILNSLEKEPFDPKWISDVDDFIEFGDTIVKALFHWDPKKNSSWSNWEKLLNESTMDKDSIITLWRTTSHKPESSDDIDVDFGSWSDSFA